MAVYLVFLGVASALNRRSSDVSVYLDFYMGPRNQRVIWRTGPTGLCPLTSERRRNSFGPVSQPFHRALVYKNTSLAAAARKGTFHTVTSLHSDLEKKMIGLMTESSEQGTNRGLFHVWH